ncbi:hypothetical protein ACVWW4_003770 [Bradyrhizobium sp. LB7.1]
MERRWVSRVRRVFLDLLLRVDVEKDAAEMARDTRIIPDQAGTGPDPLAPAGRPGNSEGDVEAAAAFGDLFDRGLDARAVVGFETRQE